MRILISMVTPKRASEDQLTAASTLDDQVPMAVGVSELRVRGEDDIDRVFTTRRRPQGVIVFHAFIKRPDGRRFLVLSFASLGYSGLRSQIRKRGIGE